MFTGIIEEVGEIVEARAEGGGRRFTLRCESILEDLDIGASISLNGTCLTVEQLDPASRRVRVFAVAETLRRTTAESWRMGTMVNLERALRASDRLGGHMVQGHVDGVGRVRRVKTEGSSRQIQLEVPKEILHLVAPKGSIAVDGVSLTVGGVHSWGCDLYLIPETLRRTTFGNLRAGDKVNLEVDLMARYLLRLVETGFVNRARMRHGLHDGF
jgi:riboflavin synthase